MPKLEKSVLAKLLSIPQNRFIPYGVFMLWVNNISESGKIEDQIFVSESIIHRIRKGRIQYNQDGIWKPYLETDIYIPEEIRMLQELINMLDATPEDIDFES